MLHTAVNIGLLIVVILQIILLIWLIITNVNNYKESKKFYKEKNEAMQLILKNLGENVYMNKENTEFIEDKKEEE
jgi:hypothetical protein